MDFRMDPSDVNEVVDGTLILDEADLGPWRSRITPEVTGLAIFCMEGVGNTTELGKLPPQIKRLYLDCNDPTDEWIVEVDLTGLDILVSNGPISINRSARFDDNLPAKVDISGMDTFDLTRFDYGRVEEMRWSHERLLYPFEEIDLVDRMTIDAPKMIKFQAAMTGDFTIKFVHPIEWIKIRTDHRFDVEGPVGDVIIIPR